MSLNIIRQQDPKTALAEEYRRLVKEFEQIKHSQVPTVSRTTGGSATFSLAGIQPTVVTTNKIIQVNLSYPQQPNLVLFGLPEWTLYNHDFANPLTSNRLPDGVVWSLAGQKQYTEILDVNWWLSWASTDNFKLAMLFNLARQDYGGNNNIGGSASGNFPATFPPPDLNPDGTTPNSMIFDFYVRYRKFY